MSPRLVALLGSLGALVPGGCHPSPPSTLPQLEPTPLVTTSPASPPAPRPAFVVLTAGETYVIPIDPMLEVEVLPGWWVGALPLTPPGAWGTLDVEATAVGDAGPYLELPVCPAGDFESECALPLTLDEPDPRAALASATTQVTLRTHVVDGEPPSWSVLDSTTQATCSCLVVHGISTDGTREPWLDLENPEVLEMIELSPYSPEEYLDECSDDALLPDLGPTAYIGGVLYLNGMARTNVCNGLNLYDGARDTQALRPGSEALTTSFPEPAGCDHTTLGTLDLDHLEDLEDTCEYDDELLAYSLHAGHLVEHTGAIGGVGDECSCASWLPVSAAVCPSPLDPCGSAHAYATRGEWNELWVSTDERLALGQDAEGLVVLATDRSAPLRRSEPVDAILGVELHPDTALLQLDLPPTVRAAIPALHPSDEGFTGAAKDWGNRSFVHLQAGRLDAAEAACFAGLLRGGSDGTRGALTYNLGRIAEARGQPDRARQYYERSLSLRPGNATVLTRLGALPGA